MMTRADRLRTVEFLNFARSVGQGFCRSKSGRVLNLTWAVASNSRYGTKSRFGLGRVLDSTARNRTLWTDVNIF